MVRRTPALFSCALLALTALACEGDPGGNEHAPGSSTAEGGAGADPDGSSSAGAPGDGTTPDETTPDGTPTVALLPARIRRLTNAEYDASVQALTGTSLAPGKDFAPDSRQDGYTLNEAQRVDPVLVKQLASAADAIAAELKAGLDEYAPCPDVDNDAEACALDFIQSFGAAAYRRPLIEDESDALLEVYRVGVEDAAYPDGIELVASALLQSAGFLYLTEIGEGKGAVITLTPYELASSLSYLLSEGPPDPELVDAALAGALETAEGREQQARRLLESSPTRAVRVLREWLGVDRLDVTAKDSNIYPEFETVKPALVRETNDFLEELVFASAGTVGDLLGADWTVADASLATFYGAEGDGLITVDGRRGVLNRGAFLSVYAHAHETAPVLRGVAIARRVACLTIPSPTELNIEVVPPLPDPDKTTRERFSVHSTDDVCAGCHSAIDSLGFAFEHFDGMGQYRELDNGLPVDSSVSVAVGADFDGDYADSDELALALAESATVRSCFARHVFRASAGTNGSEAQASEDAFVDFWAKQAAAEQGQIAETLIAYAKSSIFAHRRVP